MAKAKKKATKKTTAKVAVKKAAAKKPAKKAAKKAAKKTAKKKVSFQPKGYNTIVSVMCQEDSTKTIDFVKEVFGAKPRMVMPGPGGKIMHAEVALGDSVIMLTDSIMEPARVSSLFVYVPNVDKTLEKAAAAGAKVLMPATDQFWGDRFARFSDPSGNLWGVATHIKDLTPAQMKKAAAEAMKQMGGAG